MRPSDPIVDEVRAARDAISKEFDNDIERIGKAMQARQAAGNRTVVRLPPKRIPLSKKAV